MNMHTIRLWTIAIGLSSGLIFGSTCPTFANNRDCGLQPASRDDATSSKQFTWPTYCFTDIGTLLRSTYSYAAAINNRGQVVVNSRSGAFVYKDGRINRIFPLPGDVGIGMNGINDLGDVVGESLTDYYPSHPVIYSGGKTTEIASLGILSVLEAINDSGHIAGWDNRRDRPPVPFLYREGKVTTPTEAGQAFGINNRDAVVGAKLELLEPWKSKAFTYKNARITDLGTLPGHICSAAQAINDRDQIVGVSAPIYNCNAFEPSYPNINGGRAFLYNPAKGIVNLGTLRGTDAYSVARAINMCGQVVGFSGTLAGPTSDSGLSAFLYARGRMVDLNSRVFNRSAFQLTVASGINDHGQIVGRGSINGQLHAFLLTPRNRNADCGTGRRHSHSD
jgi:probable HAF family extracellular repeat protein